MNCTMYMWRHSSTERSLAEGVGARKGYIETLCGVDALSIDCLLGCHPTIIIHLLFDFGTHSRTHHYRFSLPSNKLSLQKTAKAIHIYIHYTIYNTNKSMYRVEKFSTAIKLFPSFHAHKN